MSDNTTPANPPAGWYPDQIPNMERYWDGAAWSHTEVRPITTSSPTEPVAIMVPAPKKPWYKRPGGIIAASAGVVVLLFILIGALNGGPDDVDPAADPAPTSTRESLRDEEPAEEVTPEPAVPTVEVPNLIGTQVAAARVGLETLGLVLTVANGTPEEAVILTQSLSEGREATAGTEVFVTAEIPKPVLTLAQENVIRQAKSYLDYSGFSRAGLIGQLEYEGYSTEDATFGADNAGADWNAEAAEKAQSYMEYTAFSRQGLYEQMAYEEFTPEQIEFALAAVGY